MRMRDCYQQNFGSACVVDQAIGKSAQPAATDVPAERMPGVGELPDAFDCRDRFQQKRTAQAGDLTVVIRNRLVELLLRDFENADVHFPRYFASTCSSGIALISPRR